MDEQGAAVRVNDVLPHDYNTGSSPRFSRRKVESCPRAHTILGVRDHARAIDDLSGEMQEAYADSVIRQCGCDKLGGRYTPIKEEPEEKEDE